MDVMRYLISNVWYWRARLDVQSLEISDDEISIDVTNHGQASASNTTLRYVNMDGNVIWESATFTVNATNASMVSLDATNLSLTADGLWELYYQVRVVDSARWVSESINSSALVMVETEESNFLTGYGLFNPVTMIAGFAAIAAFVKREETDED
jgi:hypothetical protein